MRRADRLFQIIQLLRNRRITTARWLATELEVSERTVYRDIQDLMISGVPIEGEAGIGYVLKKGFDLPPLMFNTAELAALSLGARLVHKCSDAQLASAATQALDKIESVLPEKLKGYSQETYMFTPVSRISSQVADTLGEIRLAIEQRLKIYIAYNRADGEASCRTVWPLGLFFWGSVWTLGAWCEMRQSFRNFRLDRISDIEARDEYPHESGVTLQDYFNTMREAER